LIVGVFTAIAIARSPGHDLHHGRAIFGEQKMALISQALESAWSDVVFGVVRSGLLYLRSSRKPFSHPPALSYDLNMRDYRYEALSGPNPIV
jgi:hypothetical protein